MKPLSGIGQYVYQLYSEISRAQHDCGFFYGNGWDRCLKLTPSKSWKALEQIAGASWISAKAVGLTRRGLFGFSDFQSKADIYHEPNFLPYPSVAPSVITIHDLSPLRLPDAHPSSWVRIFEKRLPNAVSNADAVLVISDFVRDEVLKYFPESAGKVTTTLLGVRNNFMPLSEGQCELVLSRFGLKYGRYILAVGTREPRKNLLTALRAYVSLPAALRERFPLAIVGMQGWLNEKFDNEVAAFVRKGQVKILGFVPDDAMNELYSGARAFLYPSLYEGFGLPPLEAMACGTAVITSNVSSLPQVVGDVGIQVEPLDTDALRTALRELLEDRDLCAQLGSLGVSRAASFTWQKTAEQTLQVFSQVLQRH